MRNVKILLVLVLALVALSGCTLGKCGPEGCPIGVAAAPQRAPSGV